MTDELVQVLVGAFMVPEDPLLSELSTTAWECTFVLLYVVLVMSGHMVSQMLWHLESLGAPGESALV